MLNSRIVITRSNENHCRTPYASMLHYAPALALLLLVAAASGCTPANPSSARYRATVFGGVAVESGLVYRTDPELRLDLYQPDRDASPRRPALVWVHGGGFTGGDRTSSVIPFPTEFAKSGYVVASIDYRLSAPTPCIGSALQSDECRAAADTAIGDAQAAVAWLRRNAAAYGIDAGRIAIAGESAGGITAAGVGTRAADPVSVVRAWISISGGIDGGAFVDHRAAPGLLFSGTADSYVPYQWSVDAADALRRAGVPVELVTLEGEEHVPARDTDEFVRVARDFLYAQLDLH